MSEKRLTELEKAKLGQPFNPCDKSFFLPMLKTEILLRKFNKSPLWLQRRRDAIISKLFGFIDGRPHNVMSPLKVICGSNIHVGKNLFSNYNFIIQDYADVYIGDNVFIGPNVSLVTIKHPLHYEERKVRVLPGSMIAGSRGHYQYAAPIYIGNNVLIYSGVIVCGGVTIGDNSVIAAGSIVTRDIPSNVLACGSPCKVVRAITEEDRLGIIEN